MSGNGARYGQSSAVLSRSVGADVIIAATTGEEFELLQGTAASVWHALETPATFVELVGTLSHSFDVSPDVIAGDLRALLSDLLERQLIEVEGGPHE